MTPAAGDVTVVVQARTGSSRLPGKVLAEVHGMPMLAFQLARLAPLACRHLVVATSDLPADDPIEALAHKAGVAVVRGPEADVLGRFEIARRQFPADTIVRLTGDCPLSDPALVAEVVELHLASDADYTCNVLPRSYPKGLDVEVMTADALAAAAAEATDQDEREHVTPFLYRRPERFGLANLLSGDDLGQEWWTVDTAADLDRIRAIADQLERPLAAGWRDVLASVGRRAAIPSGEIHLRPYESSAPGESPWRRRWEALRDGAPVGTATISVGSGRVARTFTGDERAVAAALERLLEGDQQIG